MKSGHFLTIALSILSMSADTMSSKVPMTELSCIERIKTNAVRDQIDLSVLPFLSEALTSISEISVPLKQSLPDFKNATRIDTHVHPIPTWFRELQPLAAGRETPLWDIISHIKFMAEHNIKRSILCISTPQANAFLGDQKKTIALVRLLNEYVAELVRVFPDRFSWMAVTALPYVEESVREARYSLDELGAIGVGVLTNHEGMYPGDEKFDGFWQYLQGRQSEREVVFVHPTDPVIRLEDGSLVNSKPCRCPLAARCSYKRGLNDGIAPLRAGLGEFYFETARAISSITANRTILKYPHLHWRISHGAGAFPDIEARFLLGFPKEADEARKIYATRFWYDSAGPVYPRQIKGLLAQDVPISQLVFGTVILPLLLCTSVRY